VIVYHAAKTKQAVDSITHQMVIRTGRNVASRSKLAHVSLEPFMPGRFALDVIGPDTNQAWILELEIPDDTPLEDDPADDWDIYGKGWKVSRQPIPVLKIVSITHIPNVVEWEFVGFDGPIIIDSG